MLPPSVPTIASNRPTGIRNIEIKSRIESELISISNSNQTEDLSLSNDSSPQSMALKWIIDEDELKMDANDENLVQRYVLALLYFSTSGNNWNDKGSFNWLSEYSECEWWDDTQSVQLKSGITCTEDGKVEIINLRLNGLLGTIPSEIVLLGFDLKELLLNENSLSGTLPTEIGDLSGLTRLELHLNDLEGTIPSEYGSMASLTRFWLIRNNIIGTLPIEFCSSSLTSPVGYDLFLDCSIECECLNGECGLCV